MEDNRRVPLPGLTPSQAKILEHWEQFSPQMVKDLQQRGELEQTLKSVDDQTTRVYADCLEAGLAPDQADELTRDIWMEPTPELPDLPAHGSPEPATPGRD